MKSNNITEIFYAIRIGNKKFIGYNHNGLPTKTGRTQNILRTDNNNYRLFMTEQDAFYTLQSCIYSAKMNQQKWDSIYPDFTERLLTKLNTAVIQKIRLNSDKYYIHKGV